MQMAVVDGDPDLPVGRIQLKQKQFLTTTVLGRRRRAILI
jgi:hypothetical protein